MGSGCWRRRLAGAGPPGRVPAVEPHGANPASWIHGMFISCQVYSCSSGLWLCILDCWVRWQAGRDLPPADYVPAVSATGWLVCVLAGRLSPCAGNVLPDGWSHWGGASHHATRLGCGYGCHEHIRPCRRRDLLGTAVVSRHGSVRLERPPSTIDRGLDSCRRGSAAGNSPPSPTACFRMPSSRPGPARLRGPSSGPGNSPGESCLRAALRHGALSVAGANSVVLAG